MNEGVQTKDSPGVPSTARARATRTRVLDAARECVRELGPLGATSNEIARRGCVSWGVIQYHFGSREGILLAVIQDGFGNLLDALDAFSEREPANAHDAVELLVDAIWQYCSQPDYLLYWDIIRLLSRDPTTAETVASLSRYNEAQLHKRIAHLLRETTTSDATLRTVRSLVLATMRGLALKESYYGSTTRSAAERKLLMRMLREIAAPD